MHALNSRREHRVLMGQNSFERPWLHAAPRTGPQEPAGVSIVLRDVYHQAVEFRAYLDLTRQPALRAPVIRKIQRRVFNVVGSADNRAPGVVDIGMAGAACATAAADRKDTGHAVGNRPFHDGETVGDLAVVLRAIKVDVSDFRHNSILFNNGF